MVTSDEVRLCTALLVMLAVHAGGRERMALADMVVYYHVSGWPHHCGPKSILPVAGLVDLG